MSSLLALQNSNYVASRNVPDLLYAYTDGPDFKDVLKYGKLPDYSIGIGGTQRGPGGEIVWRPENLEPYSENGDQWSALNGTTQTDNSVTHPLGANVNSFTEDSTFDSHGARLLNSQSVEAVWAYVAFDVKEANSTQYIAVKPAGLNGISQAFDIRNGLVTGDTSNPNVRNSKITAIGNNWFRVEFEFNQTEDLEDIRILRDLNGDAFADDYQGDGTKRFYISRVHTSRTPNASNAYVKTTGQPYYGPALTENGYLHEPQRTNKCQNFNASPQNLVTPTDAATFESNTTNMDAFDAGSGALFGVIDKSTELASTGYDIGNGRVFVLDNRSGSSTALINCGGTTGNTNAHSLSVVAWVDSGDSAELLLNGQPTTSFTNTSPQRIKRENVTPADTAKKLQIRCTPGNRVYITLNQLEEGATATSPIVVAGAAVTRNEPSQTTGVNGASEPDVSGGCTLAVRHSAENVVGAPSHALRLEDAAVNAPDNAVIFVVNGLEVRETGVKITDDESFSLSGFRTQVVRIGPNGATVWEDGSQVYSDTTDYSTVLSNVTDLRIGYQVQGDYAFAELYQGELDTNKCEYLSTVTDWRDLLNV